MGALKIKEEIVESLENLSEKYLKAVHALVKSLEEEEVSPWEQLDDEEKAKLKKKLEQGEKDVKEENVYTIEELRQMKKEW